ncbi:MAG: Gfo/Idh/MocA family oxidoreductase [Candidatus Poribacteria bacterium]|nr:Gfo/Idh/MocA family oxidoreductase [Candidatus Poribacteria bacterium]
MQTIGVGVIGCGGMGRSLANGANAVEDIEVICVSDLQEELAKTLAENLDTSYTTDYHELLANDDIQAVLIASPPFLHAQMAVDATNAGKHVFSEKPMAPTLEDCDAMINAASKNNVKLTIGLVCRYHATHSKVREIVHSGELGAPANMMVHRIGGPWGGGHRTPWRLERAKSGGSLMEINAHEIDFMRWTCGDVASVFAAGGQYVQEDTDYPDVVLASLNFENGAVGLLHSSHAAAVGGYGGRIDCEKGSIYFPQIWGGDASIQIKTFDGEGRSIRIGDIDVPQPVQQEIRVFIDAVRNDTPPPITGVDGRAAVEIALAAYQSVETGQPVSLPL